MLSTNIDERLAAAEATASRMWTSFNSLAGQFLDVKRENTELRERLELLETSMKLAELRIEQLEKNALLASHFSRWVDDLQRTQSRINDLMESQLTMKGK